MPSLVAEKEFTLDNSYESISYGEDGNLYCFDGVDVDVYNFIYDICMIVSGDGRVYTREEYEELEVVYE